jgi:hypothetical protein
MTVLAGRGAGRWLVLLALGLGVTDLHAAEPTVRNLDVRGLQIGGTTALVLDGDEFGTSPRLLLPFAARQQLKKGSTANRAAFDVTLDPTVVPGYYHLRVVTEGGVSLPVLVGVDRLAQRPLAAPAGPLPVALHGSVGGSTVAEARFAGKAGQKVFVEVEANRLGSKLRPVVHLYSSRRLQLAWSWPTPSLSGDARLEVTLPEDGDYTVTVHDVEYAVPGPGFFRLRIGQWSFVDQVFPPVVAKGRPQALELLGHPAAARLDLPSPSGAGVLPLAWPGEGLWSGPRPFVDVSAHAAVVGQASAGKAQELPAGPVGVSGRLLTPFGEDRYHLPVTAGRKVRLEVFAERIGSPLDAALVVRNERGDQLARAEDSPGTLDPVLDYTVPANTNALVVGVVDAQGRGGPRGVYRLTVAPGGPAAGPDFRLLSPTQRLALAAGGRGVVPVLAERRGYNGSIEVSAAGLPAGFQVEGALIPEGADGALVTVKRGDAPGDAGITHWRGRATDGEQRPVAFRDHPLARLQPWLATEIALAPAAGKAADFQVDWAKLPADVGIVPARKLVLPLQVKRPASASVVRVTLVTSQLVPRANGQPDPNKVLRLEKATELGPKTAEEKLTVLVPPELPSSVYDMTVQGELLSPDKRTVLAVAYAPVRRLPVRMPLVVRLDGPPRIDAAVDPKTGATLKVQGQVERREGLTGDVALDLKGLPPGARADAFTVKAGTNAFALNVVLPPNLPAGEIRGLKLSGTAALDAKQPNVRVRSREVELTLVVRAR